MLNKTKPQSATNKLTPEEKAYIYGLYPGCPIQGDMLSHKLKLKQIKHMPDNDLFMLCRDVDSLPFGRIKQEKWRIEKSFDTIVVKADLHSYHIDVNNGNVHLYLDGRLSTEGKFVYTLQFYMNNYYAFPLLFHKGHWARGKNALQLGIAVPDMAPIDEALDILFEKDASLAQLYLHERKEFFKVDYNNIEVFEQELEDIKVQIANKSSN